MEKTFIQEDKKILYYIAHILLIVSSLYFLVGLLSSYLGISEIFWRFNAQHDILELGIPILFLVGEVLLLIDAKKNHRNLFKNVFFYLGLLGIIFGVILGILILWVSSGLT